MHKLKFPNKTIPLKNHLQIFRITCIHLQLQPHPKPKAPPSLKFKKNHCKLQHPFTIFSASSSNNIPSGLMDDHLYDFILRRRAEKLRQIDEFQDSIRSQN
jgi:hypothetical protein